MQELKKDVELKKGPVVAFLQEPKSRSLHYATLACQADALGCTLYDLQTGSRQKYSVQVECDGFVRACVLAGITANRTWNFLQSIEGISYDATPLNLKPLTKKLASRKTKSSALCLTDQFSSALPSGQNALSCNVLQTVQEFGWLFSKQTEGGEKFLIIYGESLAHLQNLVSNKARTMMTAMSEQKALPLSAHSAESCSRVCAIDRHPSNLVVERRTLRRRRREQNKKWFAVVKTCAQHKLGCVRWAATKPFEGTLTGIINITRSLNSFTYLGGFRKDFWQTAFDRSKVVEGYPPPEARKRNRLILKWFLVKGPHTMAQRVLLEILARGNWDDEDNYFIYMQPGTEFDEVAVREQFASGLTEAMVNRRWRMYWSARNHHRSGILSEPLKEK